jgi:hypothetical protein
MYERTNRRTKSNEQKNKANKWNNEYLTTEIILKLSVALKSWSFTLKS